MAAAPWCSGSSATLGGGRRRQMVFPSDRAFWLTGELMRVHKAPYGGTFTPYTPGLTGWVPMIQTVLAF